jgi:zinc/manganese transport system permease protein
MVGPPAAAQLLTSRLAAGVALSAGLALAQAWLGLVIAYYTNWPTSFWITVLAAVTYGGAALFARRD